MKALAVIGLIKTFKRLDLIDNVNYQQIIVALLYEVLKGRREENGNKKEDSKEKK